MMIMRNDKIIMCTDSMKLLRYYKYKLIALKKRWPISVKKLDWS